MNSNENKKCPNDCNCGCSKEHDDYKKSKSQAFITQPISADDRRDSETNAAIPNDENVERNRDWVNENQK